MSQLLYDTVICEWDISHFASTDELHISMLQHLKKTLTLSSCVLTVAPHFYRANLSSFQWFIQLLEHCFIYPNTVNMKCTWVIMVIEGLVVVWMFGFSHCRCLWLMGIWYWPYCTNSVHGGDSCLHCVVGVLLTDRVKPEHLMALFLTWPPEGLHWPCLAIG